MRNSRSMLLAVALLAPMAAAWTSPRAALTVLPQSKLWVDGTSSVRAFSCKATDFTVDLDAGPGLTAAVIAGQKAVKTVTVTVPTAKLDCGNGTMNEHMREAIKANENPTIQFKLTSYDFVSKGADSVSGTLNGSLTLGGATRTVQIPIVARDKGDGTLDVTGTYPLSLKSFDLKAPSLFFGRMKVGDVVKVNFDMLVRS